MDEGFPGEFRGGRSSAEWTERENHTVVGVVNLNRDG